MIKVSSAQEYQLRSPNGHLQIKIVNGSPLHFSLLQEGQVLIPSVSVDMELGSGAALGKNNKVQKTKKNKVNRMIHPVVAIKNAMIMDRYNELVLNFKGHFSLVFRAYDDAIAYRFKTDFPDSIIVKHERCDVTLPQDAEAWFAFNSRWTNNYEQLYHKKPIDSLSADTTTQLPLLIEAHKKGKILITESDLYDYPGLYFTGNSNNALLSIFPPAVKTVQKNRSKHSGRNRPATFYPYIAKTAGDRSFPWRIFAVANYDMQLLNNEIVYKLAKPNQVENTAWINPGQVAWDWWNHWNITGVDFKAGINTKTYKYYIDFASRNDIPYVLMDNGWFEPGDLTQAIPDINMQELTHYAEKKNVGIILWCPWLTLYKQMEQVMDLFQEWGIKGIKVDYMDRDDQAMVDFYWRCAKAAAAHHLIVDFHGSHKPAGIQRTYPNAVNFEGVLGLENDKWTDKKATPGMAVIIPYIRMFAGPMDYTPGAMRNAQKVNFRSIYNYPMSQGTRCHQLAMYIIYDAPLQMLSDNPTTYEKNKECLDFITSIPTTWDETIPLKGEVGQYVAMARKNRSEYFIAAMTNWDSRNLTLDFSFLPQGTWRIVIFQDGVNADRNGIDFRKVEKTITDKDKLTIHLAPGGGWAARIYK